MHQTNRKIERRRLLKHGWSCRVGATLLGALALLGSSAVEADPSEIPEHPILARYEPHHHILVQYEFVRIYRVIIAPGDATLWHAHNLDFGVMMVNGSKLRGDMPEKNPGPEWMAPTGNFLYFPFV